MSVACRDPSSNPGGWYSPGEKPQDQKPEGNWLWALVKVILFVVLVGLVIFVHGCHGDEDNELFNSASTLFSTTEQVSTNGLP